jgi:CBS domain-containing protein
MAANGYNFWLEPVTHLQLQKPLVFNEKATIEECIKAMQDRGTGCLIIENENGEIIGIFTEQDVIRKYIGTDIAKSALITEIMSENPATIKPTATVTEAIDCFVERLFRHIPICEDDKKVIGILSVRVLSDFISEHNPMAVLNLAPRSGHFAKETAGG